MEKIAAYCGTRGIYDDMESSAKSLLCNSSVEKIHFFCENDEWPTNPPDIIEVHNVSDQAYFSPLGPNMVSGFTYMAMMRSALCYELPETDVVLSLDADTIAMKNVDGIWDTRLYDNCFAAAPEWHKSHDGLLYTNHGVVLYNLKRMRDGFAAQVIDVLNRRQYTWVEQDVCNYICQGYIAEMNSRYNTCYWTNKWGHEPEVDPALVHYAGVKRDDWHKWEGVQRYRHMTWEEALAHHQQRFAL